MNRREFLAIAATALGPPAAYSQADLRVFAARHHADSDEVIFATPRDINWERLARNHLSWAYSDPLPHEALRQVEKYSCESCGSSDVPFAAPLERSLQAGSYYLVSPDGISEIKLARLLGFVRFSLESGNATAKRQQAFGELAATPSPRLGPPEGGFVLFSRAPVHFERIASARFTANRDGGQVQCAYREGNLLHNLVLPFSGYAQAESSFAFQANAEKFCFVSWQPGEGCEQGCCQWQYTLFEATRALRLLHTSQYGCDT